MAAEADAAAPTRMASCDASYEYSASQVSQLLVVAGITLLVTTLIQASAVQGYPLKQLGALLLVAETI